MADISQIKDALDNPRPAPRLAEEGEVRPERKGRGGPIDWSTCPVKPLGIKSTADGKQTCYYLDVNKQLVGLEANNRHGKGGIAAMFGGVDWLEENFPKWSPPKNGRLSEIIGWDIAQVQEALIGRCVAMGVFSAAGRMRGRGAHRHDNGGLVLHCGDKLLASQHTDDGRIIRWQWTDPGELASFVYPGDDPIPRPWHEPVSAREVAILIVDELGADQGAGRKGLLRRWHWKRELLDPRLLAGWIGAAMIGGALGWRPNVWLTGGRGTGKSTLNGDDGVLAGLLGRGVFRTGNASEAAIRQSLNCATIPVLFDELEAKEDNRKVDGVIELARVSSSGAPMHRGGADHSAQEFTLRSAFFFSSINIPPLQPQDRSRLAILELRPFPKDWGARPNLADYNLPVLGRMLLRRMVDGWPRLAATLAKYHEALAAQGHESRAADQFGTLLACADVLLHDHDTQDGLPDIEMVLDWCDKCRPEKLREITQEDAEHARCLNHLLDSQVQARGGDERVALAQWVVGALDHAVAPLMADVDDGNMADPKAAGRLAQMGMKLVNAVWRPEEQDGNGKVTRRASWGTSAFDREEPGFLALAPGHVALVKLFDGKHWAGIYGDVLARFPGAVEAGKVRFGSKTAKAVLVPLYHVLEPDQLPDASQRAFHEEWMRAQGGEAAQ